MPDVKARIGLVVPAFNALVEYEFGRMVPHDVSFHTTRISSGPGLSTSNPTLTAEQMAQMSNGVVEAAKLLAFVKPNTIAYAFSMGACALGVEGEKRLRAQMEEATKIPCITAAGAQVEVCKEMGIRSLSILSGHTEDRTQAVISFFKDSGFEIVNVKYVPEEEIFARGGLFDTPQGFWLEHGVAALDPSADALLIAGGAYRTVDVLEHFESRTGKPLITNPPPTLYCALKKSGYSRPVKGFGRILDPDLRM